MTIKTFRTTKDRHDIYFKGKSLSWWLDPIEARIHPNGMELSNPVVTTAPLPKHIQQLHFTLVKHKRNKDILQFCWFPRRRIELFQRQIVQTQRGVPRELLHCTEDLAWLQTASLRTVFFTTLRSFARGFGGKYLFILQHWHFLENSHLTPDSTLTNCFLYHTEILC